MHFSVLSLVGLVVFSAAAARGPLFLDLGDDFDDYSAYSRVHDAEAVKAARKKLDAFADRLRDLKERDIEALFGRPVPMKARTFAMPVAQRRSVALSGLRSADPKFNKDHTEFYTIGDAGGIQVIYSQDGVSPAAIVFYLRAGDKFPKLTKHNLTQRLRWDEERLRKMVKRFEKRRAEVFVWEVDPEAEAKFFQGDYATDPRAKLEAWMKSGKKLGYKLTVTDRESGSPTYTWYRPDGTVARVARTYGKRAWPHDFFWNHPDGETEFRDEYCPGTVSTWRWSRPGTSYNIRYETCGSNERPASWTWYDKDGKQIRHEWDDNGDGIPDWVSRGREDKTRKRLAIKDSWAVNPKLIPAESRIPDQPDRRVPLRKIKPAS
jgi:hypothetical protein